MDTHTATARGHRPDLAADMAVVVATCRAQADTSGVPVREVVEHVVSRIDSAVQSASARGPVMTLPTLLSETCPLAVPGSASAARAEAVDAQVAKLVADGVDGERLHGALISLEACRHISLVWHQANKLTRSFPDYSAEDMVGWGWQGLRTALRAYDPSRFAFSTYACTRICGAIRDGVRAENPVPKRLATDIRKLQKVEETLTVELSRAPTLAEVVDTVGFTAAHAQLLARCRPTASLDELVSVYEAERVPSWLGVPDEQVDAASASELRNAVVAALGKLPSAEAQAVHLLVLDEQPLAQASASVGVSPAKLRRRRDRGLELLAEHLSAWA